MKKQGDHIEAFQRGLQRRTTIFSAISAVVLVSLTIAFSVAISQNTKENSLLQDKFSALRKQTDHNERDFNKLKTDLKKAQSEIEDLKDSVESLKTIMAEPETDRQIGYRYFKLPMKTPLFPGRNGPMGQAP